MLNDAIMAYYTARKLYNHAKYGTQRERNMEQAILNLVHIALENLRDNCRSYAEYKRISSHINYLCDKEAWPILYRANVSFLNHSINRK